MSIAAEIADFIFRRSCETIDMRTALTPTASIPCDTIDANDWEIVKIMSGLLYHKVPADRDSQCPFDRHNIHRSALDSL